jgi:pyruvate/2-oxoglutarate dehydrogenase complex dihydrolipoamide acyltransferase (E2) component
MKYSGVKRMAILEVRVPQMGEGLQEVIIHQFLKHPGDHVKRDELLYNMETDKAVMEVESAYEGTLREWLCEEGAVLPIGAPVARMEVEEAATPEPETAPLAADVAPALEEPAVADRVIPPRTRAYCKENGISEEEMRRIPAATGKLLPSDVDAYLKTRSSSENQTAIAAEEAAPAYRESALSQQQRTFIYRIKRSAQIVVPATARRAVEWRSLRTLAESIRAQNEAFQPSTFQIFAYCVTRAIQQHPKFRSILIGETVLREYDHVNLGIAVGMPNGDLTLAVVPDADALGFREFVSVAQERIQRAREGEDQATDTTQFLLTYMGPYELTDATPVLVAPAVAILFIGSAYEQGDQLLANLSLTFDHRLIQGIEAAQFLKTVVEKARNAAAEIGIEE